MIQGLSHDTGRPALVFNNRLITEVLAVLVFLLAPFTWSYIGSVGGTLIRAVDISLLLLIAMVILVGRIRHFPSAVPFALLGLIMLLLVRSAVHSDPSSFVAAIKISYYLTGSLVLATVVRNMIDAGSNRSVLFAVLIASPILALLLIGISEVFTELLGARSLLSISQVLFRGWANLFSQNLFGVSGDLETQGVSFRNSAGMAFFVAALFFYLGNGLLNRIMIVVLMILASAMFSRSVWMFQLLFFILVVLKSKASGKFLYLVTFACVGVVLMIAPEYSDAIYSRVYSDIGRGEKNAVAFEAMEGALLIGRKQGALVETSDGELTNVHNILLAYALETGFVGLLATLFIAGTFLFTATKYFVQFLRRRGSEPEAEIVLVTVSALLFFRPMVSASFEIYFSIGEWCAFAIYLALTSRLSGTPRMKHQ